MKTKNLGFIQSDLLVFGGVYSNLQALEAMQALANRLDIAANHIICTGDVVGYCAQPEEVVQAVKDWGIHCIAGNVELQLRSGATHCGCDFRPGSRCDTFSQRWYPYAKAQLSPNAIAWMNTLPDHIRLSYCGKEAIVLHGTYKDVAGYMFQSTPWSEKLKVFLESKSEVVLAGHSGLPFAQEYNGLHWLNAGVIGMPANDGTPRVWCMHLQPGLSGSFTYQHIALEYDYQKAQQLMRTNNLPEEYAQTLSSGLWDNCEILPEVETLAQGNRLELEVTSTVKCNQNDYKQYLH